MAVSITPTVDWLHHCYPHAGTHEHVAVYLLTAGDSHILIDSGSFYHREAIAEAVTAATDGSGIDALVLSHSDYPHAGNVSALDANTEAVELVASSGAPAQQGLPAARRCTIGGALTVRGRQFSFIDPPLADRSHSTWIYEHEDGVLFTADGFGAYHDAGQCAAVSTDYESGISRAAIRAHHHDNLVWLEYVDPPKIREAIDDIFQRFSVTAIAPVHGPPIIGRDIDAYRDRLDAAIRDIALATPPAESTENIDAAE